MLLFADEHFSVSLDCGTQHILHSQLQPLATGKMQWTLSLKYPLIIVRLLTAYWCPCCFGEFVINTFFNTTRPSTHSSTLSSPQNTLQHCLSPQHTLQHCWALNTLFNTAEPSTHPSTVPSPQNVLQHCPALNTLFNTAQPSTHLTAHTLFNTAEPSFNTARPSTHSSTLPSPQHTL